MPPVARIAGIALGILLAALVIALWLLLSDAADLFAPIMALAAAVAWFFGAWLGARRPRVGLVLRTLGFVAALLAVAAALSLGAFMPPALAPVLSPVLGRFGGAGAFLLLFGGILLAGVVGRRTERVGRLLDLGMATLLAAGWVGEQVDRQIHFPPPPTSAAVLAPRLELIFGIAAALTLAASLAWWRSQVGAPGESTTWQTVAGWAWRWSLLLAALGAIGGSVVGAANAYRFGLLLALLLVGALVVDLLAHVYAPERKLLGGIVRTGGWLALALLGAALLYFTTAEDLEAVMVRNTVEWQATSFWRGAFGRETLARGTGSFSGQVWNDQIQVVPGATVMVSDATGTLYSATTGRGGEYRVANVPAGSYLPLAVAPGYAYTQPITSLPRVLTVRAGQDTKDLFFQLSTRTPPATSGDPNLRLGTQSKAHVENPAPSDALRRSFSFNNRGKTLTGGLVYEPPAALGSGPFPILLIIFPGPANYWEGISVPLAVKGYVVISYFPNRLIDLDGDLSDLDVLLQLAADGKMSPRSDAESIALLGGSMSTEYIYRMALNIEGRELGKQVRATVQYGGLFDMFRLWHSWDAGEATIDPGVSDLDYIVHAFGRPDIRPEIFLFLSPRYNLGPDSLAATLLVHAGKDSIVPAAQSVLADSTLSTLGIPHELAIYPDEVHYLDTSKQDPQQVKMLEQTLAFLAENMK